MKRMPARPTTSSLPKKSKKGYTDSTSAGGAPAPQAAEETVPRETGNRKTRSRGQQCQEGRF